MALTVWNLGYADRAWLLIKEAAAEVRELPDPYTQVMVADNALMILVERGHSKYEAVRRRDDRKIDAVRIYRRSRHRNHYACLGRRPGGDPKAVDRLRESVAEFEAGEGLPGIHRSGGSLSRA